MDGSDDNQAITDTLQRMGWVRATVAVGAFLLSVFGTCLRFGPRDGIQSLAAFFYAMPQTVVLGLAVLAWLLVRNRGRVLKWGTGLLAIGQLVLLVGTWHSGESETAPIKLGLWNVCSGSLGWEEVADQIQSWDADIIGLAESNLEPLAEDTAARRVFWQQHFLEYNIIRFPRGMRLITKYPAKLVSSGKLALRSNYGVAELQVSGRTIYVVMADLLSGPRLPRGPSFSALMDLVNALPPGPVVLMGDMNTPTESVHLDALRKNFRNTFEEKGNGFYHSWPMPFPVLPLDQVWVNDQFDIGSSDLEWTVRSDHRPLLSTLRLKP